MLLTPTIILIWAGNHASIPAGWTRETTLDAKFVKGTANATNPNQSGGNATHQHNATGNHSHTEPSHVHSMTLNTTSDMAGRATGTQIWGPHTHSAHNSGALSGGGLSSVSSVYASVSNNPPYYEIIFIKPSANTNLIPDGVIHLQDSATIRTGFNFCNGSNSTPDLRDKYLRGAAGSGNAGATGGSNQNTHTLTHTHVVTAHSHSAATSPSTSPSYVNDGWGGVTTGVHNQSSSAHTHSTSLNNATPTLDANPSIVTAETVEPAFTKLIPIKNTSGESKRIFKGIIALFLGALDTIPSGWVLCDGNNGTVDLRGRHLKMANATNEAGNTGGANTHTHASQAHSHTNTHTHTASSSQHPAYVDFGAGEYYHSASGILNTTVHPVTVGNASPTSDDANTAADSQNNEPEYITVAFIKLMVSAGAGVIRQML